MDKNYWKEIADEYNKNVAEKGDIRHERIINPVVFKFLGDLTNKIVLDAGCGNGYLSRIMAKTAEKVIGVDFTEKLVNFAKNKENPKNLQFILENLEKLQFPDQIFDVVLCNMVLMDVEKLNLVIKELSRVLKNGGILIVSIIHPCFENPPRTYSIFDDHGKRAGRVVQKYFKTGLVIDQKEILANKQPYRHYHYLISDYLNLFAKAHLCLQKISEPNGNKILGEASGMNDHAPTFLIMKYKKYTKNYDFPKVSTQSTPGVE